MEMALSSSIKRVAFTAAAIGSTSSFGAASTRRSCLLYPVEWRWASHHQLSPQRSLAAISAGMAELQEETWQTSHHVIGSEGTSLSSRGQVQSELQPSLRATEAEGNGNTALDENLQRICTAMGLQDYLPGEHISVAGKTKSWGIPSDWNMKWCMDGRFYEKSSNDEVTQEWGYDGNQAWYADAGGRSSRMGMDEAEVCVLTAWVRTGFWVTEEALRYLDIQHEAQASTESNWMFSVRLKKKEVVAHVVVDKMTWLPSQMYFQRFRQGREWDFLKWQRVLPNRCCQLPMFCTRSYSSVTQENFTIVKVVVDSVENGSVYTFADSVLRPRHNRRYPRVQFDRSCSPYVQMTKARTGHYVVRPLIDGKEVGYFIVDTGTGSLAITQRKARQLGLSTFGEVHATSISGGHVMATRFSRSESLQLGPLKLINPIFVEIGIDKLLKDADGLCGFDIFHGSIVEMSHRDRTLSLYDRLKYEASSRGQQVKWQRMYLFDRVPHILAKVNGRDVMMMLDTGAAGPSLMFPSSSVQGFDHKQSADMPAPLGRGRTLYVSQADYGNVQDFEIAGCSFTNVTALVPNKTSQQMGLSGYCAGVVCAEMLLHFTIVFDYTNRRIAFLDQRIKRSNSKF